MTIIVAGFIDLENADNRAPVLSGARPFIEAAWEERGASLIIGRLILLIRTVFMFMKNGKKKQI